MMLIQFSVSHEGVPNIRKRKIKKGFRRRALDNSTLRTQWEIPRKMSSGCMGVCV